MQTVEITVKVSRPYRVIGFNGGHYGTSPVKRRDYTATYGSHTLQLQSKATISSQLRIYARRDGKRALLTFVPE